MTLAAPLGLLALLGVPAVLWLHLYRRRLPERAVAGLFLWAPDALTASAGRTRNQLLRSASLWLELLGALALALWLCGLGFGGAPPHHLVLVLDDSASMQAHSLAGPAAERARAAARAAAAALPRDGVVSVLWTGTRPELALGPRAPLEGLEATLARWQPSQAAHDQAPALQLAAELSGTTTLLLTDHDSPAVPDGCAWQAVGSALPNAAIVAARRAPDPSTGRVKVWADVLAYAASPLAATLRVAILGDTNEGSAMQEHLTLTPGRIAHLGFAVPATERPITVRLGDDALALDNEVILLAEPPRVVALASTLAPEAAAALRLPRLLAALPRVAEADAAVADLRLAGAPGPPREGLTELIVQAPGEARDAWVGPYLLERRHPLLAGLSLDGVVWSAGQGALPGVPLVAAGAQALLSAEEAGDGLRLWLNLDPERSNLPAAPDWPILVANLVEHARSGLPGPGPVNLRVGETLDYRTRTPEEARELALIDARGVRWPARGRRSLSWEARLPGLHRVVAADSQERARFAVAFVDAAESDLTGCATAQGTARPRAPAGDEATGAEPLADRRLRAGLALLLLLVAGLDWWWLARRPA